MTNQSMIEASHSVGLKFFKFLERITALLRIRVFIPDPQILIFTHPVSRIPDPKTEIKERGKKN
jgi:hypothetical protein